MTCKPCGEGRNGRNESMEEVETPQEPVAFWRSNDKKNQGTEAGVQTLKEMAFCFSASFVGR